MKVTAYIIRVNFVHPGFITTSMGDNIAKRMGISVEQIGQGSPLGRPETP